jgi:hypothetical protein
MTSVVHSMAHVAQTLKDYGPIQNYSTFNFESAVGMFSKNRICHFAYIDRLIPSKQQLIVGNGIMSNHWDKSYLPESIHISSEPF